MIDRSVGDAKLIMDRAFMVLSDMELIRFVKSYVPKGVGLDFDVIGNIQHVTASKAFKRAFWRILNSNHSHEALTFLQVAYTARRGGEL